MTPATQTDFRTALFDPETAHPVTLTNGADAPAGKRFDVYRNNVAVSLKEAMSAAFPAIEKLLGPENFSAISGFFLRLHPPQDPRLALWGSEFAAFLEGFEPLQHLGYLPDVARLEMARRTSYHSADAAPIAPDIFAATPPEQLANAQLGFAPALRVLRSPWPLLDIWHFNMTPGAPQPSSGAQDILITRQEFDPDLHLLAPGGADFIAACQNGTALDAALDAVQTDHPDFDFPALLTVLLQNSALTSLTLSDT